MKLQQVCWDLFRQNGQIGYYLLGCQLKLRHPLKEKEEECGGTGTESERHCSAQQRL